jgi:hypothetical protein
VKEIGAKPGVVAFYRPEVNKLVDLLEYPVRRAEFG